MLSQDLDDLTLIEEAIIPLLPTEFFETYGQAMMEYQLIEVYLMIALNCPDYVERHWTLGQMLHEFKMHPLLRKRHFRQQLHRVRQTRNWLTHRLFVETSYGELPEIMIVLETAIAEFRAVGKLIHTAEQ